MELHLRGVSLPGREPVELWTDQGRISRSPVPGARTIATAGFVLPGLVDAHSHPGAPEPGQPLDVAVLRADLLAHRDAGVTAVRVAGSPGRLPGWAREEAELPRVISAGPWLSTPGLFFPGWGREVAEADLPDAAAQEAATEDGWVKLRGDWIVDEETVAEPRLLPEGVLTEAVRRVHAAGGRVALGAACWTARQFLGLPGLDEGAPADFVLYDRDPVADLHVLDSPALVVLGGRVVSRAPR